MNVAALDELIEHLQDLLQEALPENIAFFYIDCDRLQSALVLCDRIERGLRDTDPGSYAAGKIAGSLRPAIKACMKSYANPDNVAAVNWALIEFEGAWWTTRRWRLDKEQS
ncbi:hypothetical protein [Afifella sp. YEN Y35]|uniref:hypothetical protein n=1 Tax=Afifella sp. YEN Y35 TaxID=3388337 RepID=UPI0039E0D3E1